MFTTEKKQPDKAERNAVFEDYRIPKDQRKNYVAEYRVPVSLGGSNAYSNIEALIKTQAKIKHQVQKQLEEKLKRKEISLGEAHLRVEDLVQVHQPQGPPADFHHRGLIGHR